MNNEKNKNPNILMIVVDQQRLDCLGFSEKYNVVTPNIDKLARDGVCFTNAYTNIPLCCPARQTLLCGRRNESFGAHWNYDITLPIADLSPEEYTYSNVLKKLDYNMAYLGKWHVSKTYTPLDYGYDYYFGEYDYDAWQKEHYPHESYKNGWLGEDDYVPLEEARTHFNAALACEKMEEYAKESKPWHIRVDYMEPHLPCRPAGKFCRLFTEQDVQEWGSFQDDFHNKPYIQKQQILNWEMEDANWEEDYAILVARYFNIIAQVDESIGMMLDKLKELGLDEDTVVIYTSDHGDMCGSHKMLDKHYCMYDDIVRVPLIVKGKHFQPRIYEGICYNTLDFFPTLLDGLEQEIPKELHGKSLLDILKGKDEQLYDYAISTYNGQQFGLYNERMITDGKTKYVYNPTDIDEFYHIEEDPWELENQINNEKYKQVIADYRKHLYEDLVAQDDKLMGIWLEPALLRNKKLGE